MGVQKGESPEDDCRVFLRALHRLIGGGYLLSHFRSTIGVVRFNFSVRNGKRWNPHAVATLVLFAASGFLRLSAEVPRAV